MSVTVVAVGSVFVVKELVPADRIVQGKLSTGGQYTAHALINVGGARTAISSSQNMFRVNNGCLKRWNRQDGRKCSS